MSFHKNSDQHSRGFLLLTVMGLLALLLVLCTGFIVSVRAQTNAVLHLRDRSDLNNLAYSGLDWAEALIANHIFVPGTDRVDPSKFVTSAYSYVYTDVSPSPVLTSAWYKDLATNVTVSGTVVAGSNYDDWSTTSARVNLSPKRETKWVYLPADYILEGGLRARMAVQILDANAFFPLNDGLEDGIPTQAQQAFSLHGALGWRGSEILRAKYDSVINHAFTAVNYPYGNVPLRYDAVWRVATHSTQSTGGRSAWTTNIGNKGVPDPHEKFILASSLLSLNTCYFTTDGAESCLAQTQVAANTNGFGGWGSNYMPITSCRPYTDPDTGRAPLNVNTCPNSGELLVGARGNGNTVTTSSEIESVFNLGALRRIIKVGSFYANNKTNMHPSTGIRYLDPYLYFTHLPDPLNSGAFLPSPFLFDATTHLVRLTAADGVTEVYRDAVTGLQPVGSIAMKSPVTMPSVAMGASDPMTIGTPDPGTGLSTPAPGRVRTDADDSHYPLRDPSTAGTVDPATVSIDPVDSKMSYTVTADPNAALAAADPTVVAKKAAADAAAVVAAAAAPGNAALAAAATTATNASLVANAAYVAAYNTAYTALSTVGMGRPYVYKSSEDLYVMLSTEERVQLEKLKTKLAYQYQETLARYFVASFRSNGSTYASGGGNLGFAGNIGYPAFDNSYINSSFDINKFCYKNYYNTYKGVLGTTEAAKVVSYAQNYNYTGLASTPRFPVSVDQFRTNVKADLLAMVANNNAVYAGWKYNSPASTPSASKDGGEYVNFDAAGLPEICAGKLDKRTASAIFDNICPGKRYLFPAETNIGIKDPIGQLNKRRVGIDEESINYIYQTPTPTAPAAPLWKPKVLSSLPHGVEVAAYVPANAAFVAQGAVNNQRMNDPYNYYLYKEDQNENGLLDKMTEDANGNGVLDGYEDVNHNGLLDLVGGVIGTGEDLNANGVLDYGEDLNHNGILDIASPEDIYPAAVTTGTPAMITQVSGDGIMQEFETNDRSSANRCWSEHIDNLRERGQEVWTADPNFPVKGHDYLTTTGGIQTTNTVSGDLHTDRFIDENIFFDTASNPIFQAWDVNHPNCLIHPLPADGTKVKDSNGIMVPIVSSGLLSDFPGNFNAPGAAGKTQDANGKFDTIEYIPGHSVLDNGGLGVDLNGDGKINTYYRTPERQLMFSPDCFSRELTTTSVAYNIVVTVELCDAASVLRTPAAPIILGHSEINVAVQLAPDIEGSTAKELASEYVDGNPNPGKRDPGLHYYRNNLPTTRKAHSYDFNPASATYGEIITYNCGNPSDPLAANVGTVEPYDPVREAKGFQIRGGTEFENSTRVQSLLSREDYTAKYTDPPGTHTVSGVTINNDINGNNKLDPETVYASARQWVDPLGVPDDARDAALISLGVLPAGTSSRKQYYSEDLPAHRYQNKRRFVIKNLINLGAGY